MKRLLLLRHAKAVAGSTRTGDRGRPLNERGRSDAPCVGTAMHHSGYLPDRVLCSSAKRTVETWEHVAPELGVAPKVSFLDKLYLAPAATITELIREWSGNATVVMIIGHNPGLGECAIALARKPRSEAERKRHEALAEKFPTAALAVLDFEVESWGVLEPGTGALVDLLKPKELRDE